jgi:hypothetical protein
MLDRPVTAVCQAIDKVMPAKPAAAIFLLSITQNYANLTMSNCVKLLQK